MKTTFPLLRFAAGARHLRATHRLPRLLALLGLLTSLSAAAQVRPPAVTTLSLFDADADSQISFFPPNNAASGYTLNLRALPTRNLSIEAGIDVVTVGSVVFSYDGNPTYKVENVAPYTIAGDNTDSNGRTDYYAWTPTLGTHTLTATPYSQRSGGGTAGTALSLTFTVVDVPLRAPDLPSGSPNLTDGLTYAYYEGTNWSALPNFAALTPVRTGSLPTDFSLAPRFRDDNFAFRYTGYFNAFTSGEYTFYTTSDDGSQLFVGTQLVVNNDGLHAARERSGKIMLSAGLHAFTVTFFDRGGDQVLNVAYGAPAQGAGPARNRLFPTRPVASPAPTPAPVLAINAGGGAVGPFLADQFFGGPEGAPAGTASSTSARINTELSGSFDLAPAAVYQSQREGTRTGYFVYSIRSGLVEGQSYRLRLHFADIDYTAAGQRQFNVVLNGTTTLLTNFDIVAESRAEGIGVDLGSSVIRPIVREFTVVARPASSSTGNLFLRFAPGAAGEPTVSGIELLPLPAPAPPARQALASARAAGADETVLLYPNPARDQLTVRLQAGAGEDVRVDVLDALARRVAGAALRANAGWNDVRLPLGALPGGVYSVTVQRGAERTVRRLVVAP